MKELNHSQRIEKLEALLGDVPKGRIGVYKTYAANLKRLLSSGDRDLGEKISIAEEYFLSPTE
jgi:hypothetical protein